MIQLDEAGLSRILKHINDNEICFISACRGENSNNQNNVETKRLETDVRNLGYGFIQVIGGYTENAGTSSEKEVHESSIVVINTSKQRDFDKEMLYLCGKYKQECILLKSKNYKTAWYDKDGNRVSPVLDNLSIHDFEKGFSKIHGQKFSLIETNVDFSQNESPRSLSSVVYGMWLREAMKRNVYDWRNYNDKETKSEVLTENPNTILKSALVGKNPNVESLTIITSENPLGQKYSRKDNKERLSDFKAQLKAGGHPYKNVIGKYGNKEHSFVIFNLSRDAAENYARVYEQESFIFGIKKDDGMVYEYWVTKDGGTTYGLAKTTDFVRNEAQLEDYFSRLHSYKFNVGFDFSESLDDSLVKKLESIQSPEDKHWIKEYVNGNRVGMSSYLHYKNLYKS